MNGPDSQYSESGPFIYFHGQFRVLDFLDHNTFDVYYCNYFTLLCNLLYSNFLRAVDFCLAFYKVYFLLIAYVWWGTGEEVKQFL